MDSQMVGKTFAFTLNNPNDEEREIVLQWDADDDVLCCAVGKEIGKDGTPHLQGVVRFGKAKRLTGLKKILSRAHWERCISPYENNAKYCKKEGQILLEKVDKLSTQGRRVDLEVGVLAVQEGGIQGLVDTHPTLYVKYTRGFESLANRLQPQRSTQPMVWWIWGPTGTGKTRLVHDLEGLEPDHTWISGDDLKWFDGYSGQEVALIDDFRGDMCKLRWLLRLLDRYPVRVQIKGGMAQFAPKRIYITSAVDPRGAYPNSAEKLEQLERRITRVISSEKPGWDCIIRAAGVRCTE